MEIKLWEIVVAMLPYWVGGLGITQIGTYYVCNINSMKKFLAVIAVKYFLYNICVECILGYYARGTFWFFVLELLGGFSGIFCFYILWKAQVYTDSFFRFLCMAFVTDSVGCIGTVLIHTIADRMVTLPGRTSENCVGIHTLFVWVATAVYALFVWQLGKRVLYRLRSYRVTHEKLFGMVLILFLTPSGPIVVWLGNYSWTGESLIAVCSGILVCLIIVALPLEIMLYLRMRQKNLRLENVRLRIQERILTGYGRSVLEQLDQVGRLRHDIANHIQTLEVLEKDMREREEVIAYESRMKTQYQRLVPVRYCDNHILNAMICNKVNLCEREGISTSIDARSIKLETVSELDLLGILFNLFDNAIEGCRGAAEGVGRFLTFSGFHTAAGLFLKMENSCGKPQLEGGQPVTTKADKALHGFGLRIVRDLAKKYGGNVEYESGENIFSVKVFLDTNRKVRKRGKNF